MVKKEMKYSATPGVFLGPCSKVKSAFLAFSQKESRFHKSETTFYRLVGLSVTLQSGFDKSSYCGFSIRTWSNTGDRSLSDVS